MISTSMCNSWKETKLSALYNMKYKAVQKYLLQFNRLTFKQGILHHLYISNDVEYCQLIHPCIYRVHVFLIFHDEQGHQSLDLTVALVKDLTGILFAKVFLITQVSTSCCQVAEPCYTSQNMQPESFVAWTIWICYA